MANFTFKKKPCSFAVSVALLNIMPLSAMAAEDQANEEDVLEVITVNATKTPTSLMKTPVAVTAMNEEALNRQDITEVRNLSGVIPNIQLGLSPSDSGVQASIRGVTSTNFTEIGDPAVGIHIDGLYSPRPQGSLALMFDVQQVEALRGAQGTLFGRNSTAGVINVIPNKPEFGDNYGSVTLDRGNYDKKQIRTMFNKSITDEFAIRGTFMMEKRDGYIKQHRDLTDRFGPESSNPDGVPDVDQRYNKIVGKEDYYMNANHWGARISARWQPIEAFDWTLTYESYKNDGAGEVVLKDCESTKGTIFECEGDHWETNVNVPGELDMSIDTLRNVALYDINDNTTLEYRFAYAVQQRAQQQDSDAGLHPHASEVSVVYDANDPDVGGIPAWGNWGTWQVDDRATFTLDTNYVSTVHEFQIKQKFDDWRYVAGFFWLHENNEIEFAQNKTVNAPFGYPYGQYYDQERTVDSKAIFAQADYEVTEDLTITIGGRYSRDEKEDKGGQTYGRWSADSPWYYNGDYDPGVLGEADWKPHQGYDLTTNMGEFAKDKLAAYGEPTANPHSKSWSKFNWRLGAQYDIDADQMVFASLATGYKAGGFGDKFDVCGGRDCVDKPGPDYSFLDYEPESTTNFEIGYKGKLFDDKLNLTTVFFYTDFEDMQVTGSHVVGQKTLTAEQEANGCPDWNPACDAVTAWKTENIGNSKIQGLEVEYDFIPWKNGRVQGFFSWLDTSVEEYKTYADNLFCGYRDDFGAPACPETYLGDDPELRGRQLYDVTGNQLPYSPEFSFAVSLSHEFVLENGYAIIPWVQTRWQDDMYFSVRNLDNQNINDKQDSYTNVDATIKLLAPDADWYIEAYGNNLTDNIVKNWWDHQGGYPVGSYNPPRMYGVRAHFSF